MTESSTTIAAEHVFQRRMQAVVADVFHCFTESERLALWFSPSSQYLVKSAQAKAEPGGALTVTLGLPDGNEGHLVGTFQKVVAPRFLSFDLAVSMGAMTSAGPMARAQVEVELAPIGNETHLELTLRPQGDSPYNALLKEAMSGILGRLPLALDRFVDQFVERVSQFPRYRSQFGGLWPDLSDAERRIEGKVELGLLSADEAQRFRSWREKGYVVFENAIAETDLDAFAAELESSWQAPRNDVLVECFRDNEFHYEPMRPEHRARQHKVLDIHASSEKARNLIFSAPIRQFLEKLFERPAMAFQSLLFERGTGQTMHQDTAFVGLSSPMEFVGVWIALEDVVEGSGALRFYEGSHEIDEYLWMGRSKVKPYGYMDEGEFFQWVEDQCTERELPMRRFLAKRGDVLIWHADLVHGGGPNPDPNLTRRSLVTHLCPVDVDPEYLAKDPSHRRSRHQKVGYWTAMNRN